MITIDTFQYKESSVAYNLTRGGSICSLKLGGKEIFYADPVRRNDVSTTMRETTRMFPQLGSIPADIQKQYHYKLPRHGFAREGERKHVEQTGNRISFGMQTNQQTLHMYPGECTLLQSIELEENSAKLSLQIENTGCENLLCSPGNHTYYYCPNHEKENVVCSRNMGLNKKQYQIWMSGRDTIKIPNPGECDVSIPKIGKLSLSFHPLFTYLRLRTEPHKDFICIEPTVGEPEKRSSEALNIEKGGKERVSFSIKLG